MTGPAQDTPEDYQFMPRLMGSYLLAVVAWIALGKSLYIEAVTTVLWVALVVHLFRRFGRRALWSLLGAPFVFYWAWLLWRVASNPPMVHPAGAIIV